MDFSAMGVLICCHLTLQMCDLQIQGLVSLSTSLPVCTQAQRLTMGHKVERPTWPRTTALGGAICIS